MYSINLWQGSLIAGLVALFNKSTVICIAAAIIAIIIYNIQQNRHPDKPISDIFRQFFGFICLVLLLQSCSLLVTAFLDSVKWMQSENKSFFVSMVIFNVHYLVGSALALIFALKACSIYKQTRH